MGTVEQMGSTVRTTESQSVAAAERAFRPRRVRSGLRRGSGYGTLLVSPLRRHDVTICTTTDAS
jgi:hypothetical protein